MKRIGQPARVRCRTRTHILTLLVALAPLAPAVVEAQAVISNERNVVYRLPGREEFEQLGRAVVGLDDIDRDGVPDFAASGAERERENRPSRAFVDVFSGARGERIYTIYGPPKERLFGYVLKTYADVDGDGLRELVVTDDETRIWIHSARTGTLLKLFTIGEYWRSSDLVLECDIDFDGDSWPEFILADSGFSDPLFAMGRIACFNPRKGSRPVWNVLGSRELQELGISLVVVPDQNDDGIPDVLTGEVHRRSDTSWGRVVDGQTGRTIRTLGERERFRVFGFAMARLDDLNGDHVSEIAVGTTVPRRDAALAGVGQVLVLDGMSLDLIRVHRGLTPARDIGDFKGDRLGQKLLAMPDLDGDGVGEYVAVAQESGGFIDNALTHIYLYSGRSGEILNILQKLHAAWAPYAADISLLGDINADGNPEVLVGSPDETMWRRASGVVRPIHFDLDTPVPFLRGDANWDGQVDVSDSVALATQVLFQEFDLRCPEILDVDGDDFVAADDVSLLLYHLFLGEGRPAPPYPHCGPLVRLLREGVERFPCTESNCR